MSLLKATANLIKASYAYALIPDIAQSKLDPWTHEERAIVGWCVENAEATGNPWSCITDDMWAQIWPNDD